MVKRRPLEYLVTGESVDSVMVYESRCYSYAEQEDVYDTALFLKLERLEVGNTDRVVMRVS